MCFDPEALGPEARGRMPDSWFIPRRIRAHSLELMRVSQSCTSWDWIVRYSDKTAAYGGILAAGDDLLGIASKKAQERAAESSDYSPEMDEVSKTGEYVQEE